MTKSHPRSKTLDSEVRKRNISGLKLTEDQLQAMWILRGTIIKLKPSVSAEDDREKFIRYFRRPEVTAVLYQDSHGTIHGFFAWYQAVLNFKGRRSLVASAEYAFFSKALRGKSYWSSGLLPLALRAILRYIYLPKYAISLTYPGSYASISRMLAEVKTAKDVDLADKDRFIINSFLTSQDIKSSDGIVELGTLPPVKMPYSEAGKACLAHYEQGNAKWKDGYALVVFVDAGYFGTKHILKLILDVIKR